MTMFEVHRAQWQALKDKPLKDKLQHIVTYYGVAIVLCLCVVGVVVSWIVSAVTQKEAALTGYLLNSTSEGSAGEELAQEFLQRQQLDAEEYAVRMTSNVYFFADQDNGESYYVLESMVAQIAGGMLDFVVTDTATYPVLSAYYADLRTVLTAEQLEKYRSCLVYVEKADLEALTSGTTDTVEIPEYYRDSAGLEDPVPMGMVLPESCRLLEGYQFLGDEVIFGFMESSKNQANAVAFWEFITE